MDAAASALNEYLYRRRLFGETRPAPYDTVASWLSRLAVARLAWELAREDLKDVLGDVGPIEGSGCLARIGADGEIRIDRPIREKVHAA